MPSAGNALSTDFLFAGAVSFRNRTVVPGPRRGRGAVWPARVTPWGELTRSPTMRDFLTLKKRLVHNIQVTDHWVNGLLS
jgi:hypothetical protein